MATRRRAPLAPACERPHPCPKPLQLQVLGRARFFTGLSASQLSDIGDRCVARGYAAGEAIYRVGAPARSLYVLASGRAKITHPRPGGTDVVMDVVLPGEMFGALPALGEPAYEETAEALTTSCALAISAEEFDRILREYPSVALAVIGTLSRRLVEARRALRRLHGESVRQRLAATLLDLADRAGQDRADMTLLQLPLTRVDLARMAGATPESVSRAISSWKRAGLIDSGRRWVAIRDRAALQRLALR